MVSALVLIYFSRLRIVHTIKTNFITLQTVDPEIYSIFIFYQSSRVASPPHFVCRFPTKIFLILYSINWLNFIVWLPLLLVILCNMYIVIISLVCDVINFEINHIFHIKQFFPISKRSRQKRNYLKNAKTFLREEKHFFITFKGLSLR